MPDCQKRMIQNHPRSRESHYLTDLFSLLRFITVYLTVCTECLLLHKRTFLASKLCVIGKFLTDRAHLSALTFFFGMIFPAVQLDHFFHNVLLSLTFLFHFVHVILHLPVFLFLFLLSRKNYNTWQIQTTIRQILPIGTFFIHKNPMPMITVTVPMMRSFVPMVMALFCTKLSRCFLYKFVPRNHE